VVAGWRRVARGLLCRAAAAYGAEVTALSAAASVKERLRFKLVRHAMWLGPSWIGGQRAGELTTLATSGLDALGPFFGRYLPQLLLAGSVPIAVVATVTAQDWLSGLIIAVTLPLIPLFAMLIGAHARARTQRSWRLLALLGGHFLDVVQGLTTLKVFGQGEGSRARHRRDHRPVPGERDVKSQNRLPVCARARTVSRAGHRADRG